MSKKVGVALGLVIALVGFAGAEMGRGKAEEHSVSLEPRIMFGREAAVGEFPWFAAIYHSNRSSCGGSLIDRRHVVTADHCVDEDPKILSVVLGEHFIGDRIHLQQEFRVQQVYRYNGSLGHQDLAVLRLDGEASFRETSGPVAGVKSIQLTSPSRPVLPGETLQVCGFGYSLGPDNSIIRPKFLQASNLTIDSCNDLKGQIFCDKLKFGEPDASRGDSGSGVVRTYGRNQVELVGLVSHGCYGFGFYWQVAHLVDWIDQVRSSP